MYLLTCVCSSHNLSFFFPQGPCHIELHAALDTITLSQQKLGEKFTTFYLPNCDNHGYYKAKQVRIWGFYEIKSFHLLSETHLEASWWFIPVVSHLSFSSSVSHLWLDPLLVAGVSLPGMGRRSQDRAICSVTQTVNKKLLTEGWTYTHLNSHRHKQIRFRT